MENNKDIKNTFAGILVGVDTKKGIILVAQKGENRLLKHNFKSTEFEEALLKGKIKIGDLVEGEM